MGAVQQVLSALGGSGSAITFPEYLSATSTGFSADATSHAVAMPATVNSGDLLVMQIVFDGGPSITVPAGWLALIDRRYAASAAMRYSILYRIADGTEGGTTVDVVTSDAERAAAIVHRIQAGTFHTTPPIRYALETENSGTAPDPPSLSPIWGAADTLWLAGFWGDNNGTVSAYPYANNNTHQRADVSLSGTAYCEVASCTTEVNASSLNPGAFTKSANAAYRSFTAGVQPLPAAAAGSTYEVFTSSGTFNVPSGVTSVDALIIAGGGGGGGCAGITNGAGGGGAGGLIEVRSISVTPLDALTVTVGAGGSAGSASGGGAGGNSSFEGNTATGGGGGQGYTGTVVDPANANTGGSGGGVVGVGAGTPAGGVGTQGGDGGQVIGGGAQRPGSGGGGYYEQGGAIAGNPNGGKGGDGVTLSSIGWGGAVSGGAPSSVGGGGGGGRNGGTAGSGGLGGGGAGASGGNGTAGTANTGGGGGGGGGASGSLGGSGGSGLVIIRYAP